MTNEPRFDRYTWRARIQPALLAVGPPILAFYALVGATPRWTSALPLAFGTGILLFLASFVRALGTRLEGHLVSKWGGLPTTKMLRHREAHNSVVFRERRKALAQVTGVTLPTKAREQADPDAADEAYIAATRRLIARVRDRKADFPVFYQDSIAYGFARNMLALKPFALVFLAGTAGATVLAIVRRGLDPTTAALAVSCTVVAAMWIFFVRQSWVLQAGNIYAERLFEILDTGLVTSHSTASTPPSQRPLGTRSTRDV